MYPQCFRSFIFLLFSVRDTPKHTSYFLFILYALQGAICLFAIAFQNSNQFFPHQRLRQICRHACRFDFFDISRRNTCRYRKNRNPFGIRSIQTTDTSGRSQPIHLRHHYIHQNNIKAVFGRIFEKLQCIFSIFRLGDNCTCLCQYIFCNFKIQRIIICQKDINTGKTC